MESRSLNISFNKSGSGSITPKLCLPITWLREMDIDQENKKVIVSLIDNSIIIRKPGVEFNLAKDVIDERDKNISFNKSGSGSITTRIILPITYTRHLNVSEDDKAVVVNFENNMIIIKKA